MATRGVDDPWYTVLYRDPRTYWWAPALFVGCFVVLLDLLVLNRSAPRSLTLGAFMGLAVGAGSFLRWRRSRGG